MSAGTGRKQLVGMVVSDAMSKTVVVRVTRLIRHRVYQRVMRRSKKFKVHDPDSKAHRGDEVRIEETRPISKDKRWRLVEILRKGEGLEDREAQRVAELEELGMQKPGKEGREGKEGNTKISFSPVSLHSPVPPDSQREGNERL